MKKARNYVVDVAIDRAGYQLKKQLKKSYSSSFLRSFYEASLTFGHLWYFSSTTYAAIDNRKIENTIGGYPLLFAWRFVLY